MPDGPRLQARFDRPSGICIDSSGNIYVAEWLKLRRISPAGVVSTVAALPEAFSYHLAAAPDGKIYIGYSPTGYDGYILRYVPGETSVTNFVTTTSLAGYTEVAVDSAGNVYASTRGGIARFTPDGTYSQYAGTIWEGNYRGDGPLGTAAFTTPRGMAFDAEGTLILSEGRSVRAIRNGSVDTLVGGGATGREGMGSVISPSVADLCVTSDGRIFGISSNTILMLATSPDVDQDSVPDLLEEDRPPYVIGTNDKEEDTDGDGYSNALELQLGMDPAVFDPTTPQPTVTWFGDRPSRLQWKGSTWAQQRVYYSTDMADWRPFAIDSKGEFSNATIPMSLWGESRLFFKVVTKP